MSLHSIPVSVFREREKVQGSRVLIMATLVQQKCLNHTEREAAARCPSCRRFYCRECIVDHEGRVICSSCLKKLTASEGETSSRLSWIRDLLLFVGSVGILWFTFYGIGRVLMRFPDTFHAYQY